MIMTLLAILVYSLVIFSIIILTLTLFKSNFLQKKCIFIVIILFLFLFTTITLTSLPNNFVIQKFLTFSLYPVILLTIFLYKSSKNLNLVKLCILIILSGNFLFFL